MKRSVTVKVLLIIALSYLFTGSAYMSEFYRLMEITSPDQVDMVSSGWNYLMQASGLLALVLLMRRNDRIMDNGFLIISLYVLSMLIMSISHLFNDLNVIVVSGYFFNFLIGAISGCYITLLALKIPKSIMGLVYALAYTIGSSGTYLISLIGGESFMTSYGSLILYIIIGTAAMFLFISLPDDEDMPHGSAGGPQAFRYLIPVVSLMTIISVIGSGLFYSLPQTEDSDWNFIRLFYGIGLIISGIVLDRNRLVGSVLTVGSLIYPLIHSALIGNGVTGMISLILSYVFRGFLTIFYTISFADIAKEYPSLKWAAPIGLLVSRLTESFVTLALIFISPSEMVQLIVSAVLFIPLLILVAMMEKKKTDKKALSQEEKLAMFSRDHELTARESEILIALREGLTDQEIADRFFISKNTVRFHISNIMKKTQTSSRVEAVRAFELFS